MDEPQWCWELKPFCCELCDQRHHLSKCSQTLCFTFCCGLISSAVQTTKIRFRCEMWILKVQDKVLITKVHNSKFVLLAQLKFAVISWFEGAIYWNLSLLFVPESLADEGRSVSMWKRSCSKPAERRLSCPGWGRCNTFLQRKDQSPVLYTDRRTWYWKHSHILHGATGQ